MSAKLCSQQELCRHYTDGSKRRVHHIRITNPCRHWLALDCEKILLLAELQAFTTGEIMACDISKIARIKDEIKELPDAIGITLNGQPLIDRRIGR